MGEQTIEIEFAGIKRSKRVKINKPEIQDGFWSDPVKGRTTEATYGEKVKFTIGTKDIPDGTELNLTLYDYDGNFNPDDELSRGFKTTVKSNMAEIEFVPDLKWNEEAKYETDKVVEVYFKVEAEIVSKRLTATNLDKKLSVELPKKENGFLKIYTPKSTLTIIIELPYENYTPDPRQPFYISAVYKLGLLGHTGIAIENEYYDYGPEDDIKKLTGTINESKYGDINYDGNTTGVYNGIGDPKLKDLELRGDAVATLGRPWWDQKFSKKKNLTLADLILILNDNKARANLGIKGKVHILEIDVTKKQAKTVKDWWDNKYVKNLGIYKVAGKGSHCTSTVRDSLLKAKLISPGHLSAVCTPATFYRNLEVFLAHTAGKERGKSIRIRTLKDIS